MKIENIDIQATIEKAKALVRNDEQLSAATKSMFEILILVITLPAGQYPQVGFESRQVFDMDISRVVTEPGLA